MQRQPAVGAVRCRRGPAVRGGRRAGNRRACIRTRRASSPPIWQPWRRCSTRRGNLAIPTLIHTSEPVGHAYPGKGTVTPDMLEALIRAYPDNTFVFAHFGGGMPFYALMPEVAASLANVYFDSAAFTHLYRPEVFQTAVTACGVERILFASDYPACQPDAGAQEDEEGRPVEERRGRRARRERRAVTQAEQERRRLVTRSLQHAMSVGYTWAHCERDFRQNHLRLYVLL